MAKVANPRKVFQFVIEINGILAFEVQSAELPERETAQTKHGDTNHDIKTAGRVSLTNLKIEKLRATPEADLGLWAWLLSGQNIDLGGGSAPSVYKQDIVLRERDESGLRTKIAWLLMGAWPCKQKISKFDRNSSDNIIESMEFAVDNMRQLPQ